MSGADGFRLGSWLSGPESERPRDESGYPGKDLGLPESGSRSLARTGRRLVALLIDWLIGYGLAGLAMAFGLLSASTLSTAVLAIWLVLGVVSLSLFGFTPGQLAMGLIVVPLDDAPRVSVLRAVVRGVLVALAVPALFTDADGRGFQDRLTNTAVLRR
ncbi:RDD family protein [Mycobacterium sp. CBMA 234]|uniref:RDD family protein n=1 Tax=Mycolicibacterium sp. CBMA 234 TaxID=1918495 RepID=UPI0012DC7998|nr:RDD family protein [Mycolicibacterium sp. CBMA 234]MUL65297.1 RDD family protein [Mycolicibacterium sp. CBMA 234]